MEEYKNEKLVVRYDPAICIHAGECVRGLNSVFSLSRKPWIDVNGAPAAAIIEQIKCCPSGALTYELSRWQTTVSEDVLRERLYQDKQWGHEIDDTRNTPWMWTAYICSYATKWMKDPFNFTREDTDEFYDRMIQTAAIATAAAESVVRQRDMNGKTFYEPPDG